MVRASAEDPMSRRSGTATPVWSLRWTATAWAPEFGGREWVLNARDGRVRTGCFWFSWKVHGICTPHSNRRKYELILFRGRKADSAPKCWRSPGHSQGVITLQAPMPSDAVGCASMCTHAQNTPVAMSLHSGPIPPPIPLPPKLPQGAVKLAACDSTDKRQRFVYDAGARAVRAYNDQCLVLPQSTLGSADATPLPDPTAFTAVVLDSQCPTGGDNDMGNVAVGVGAAAGAAAREDTFDSARPAASPDFVPGLPHMLCLLSCDRPLFRTRMTTCCCSLRGMRMGSPGRRASASYEASTPRAICVWASAASYLARARARARVCVCVCECVCVCVFSGHA